MIDRDKAYRIANRHLCRDGASYNELWDVIEILLKDNEKHQESLKMFYLC